MDSTVSGEIGHVSDTALMVAACRAAETELEDAFFRDPFAARLCGDRGFAILEAMPNAQMMRFGIAVRTRVIDDLVQEALASYDVATVLSVGCGLDTRAWRMELPHDLRWIEVDFERMLDYKETLMADEAPRCRRERLAVDVTDAAQRRQMYAAAGAARTLMITEGLLLYLPAGTVEALAAESGQRSGVKHWISDITTTAFTAAIQGANWMQSLSHVRARDALTGEAILEALDRHGWTPVSKRSYITDLGFARDRIVRMRGGAAPGPMPIPPDDPTGAHCFSHASQGGAIRDGQCLCAGLEEAAPGSVEG